MTEHQASSEADTVEMPKPSVAPMVMAVGIALAASGLVTHVAFSVAGGLIAILGLSVWIRDLLPGCGIVYESWVPIAQRAQPVKAASADIEALRMRMPGHRMRVPETVHPYSAGLKGGAVGGVLMAVTALCYGMLSGRGPWYPVNLLAAIVVPGSEQMTIQELQQFSALALVAGIIVHLVTSTIVGLLFGIVLPTLPRWPLLWGGLVAPLMWTGFVSGFMGVLNPVLNQHVDWPWFVVSQFVYGLSVGVVVTRSEKRYIDQVPREAGVAESEHLRPERNAP